MIFVSVESCFHRFARTDEVSSTTAHDARGRFTSRTVRTGRSGLLGKALTGNALTGPRRGGFRRTFVIRDTFASALGVEGSGAGFGLSDVTR